MRCWACGKLIRRCGCAAHPPPMWKHYPSGYHRCGPEGRGPTLAEPKREADGYGPSYSWPPPWPYWYMDLIRHWAPEGC